jgi:hypothetical protein
MKILWWFAALLIPGGSILVAYQLYRKVTAKDVSDQWLSENYRRGLYNTFEGVSISWPIDKLKNEAAWRNTRTLRKRA